MTDIVILRLNIQFYINFNDKRFKQFIKIKLIKDHIVLIFQTDKTNIVLI